MNIAEGARPSPNIWNAPGVYEKENRAVDPDGVIEAAMRAQRPWTGARMLDIGCGTGFHLPRFAAEAAHVIGVEPHGGLISHARRRCAGLRAGLGAGLGPGLGNLSIRQGTAQALPVPDAAVDIAHARWAYFFGPGCEPGLRELDRVMRKGGTAFIIDNDATRSTFGGWFRRAFPDLDPATVERFWSLRGWQRQALEMSWRFDRRADFEAVVRIEFVPEIAEQVIAEHRGLEVDYAINLWSRTY